jgi:hypothetical protein
MTPNGKFELDPVARAKFLRFNLDRANGCRRVPELKVDAIVRHAKMGRGLGLKFSALWNEDRPRLAELSKRHRRSFEVRIRKEERATSKHLEMIPNQGVRVTLSDRTDTSEFNLNWKPFRGTAIRVPVISSEFTCEEFQAS